MTATRLSAREAYDALAPIYDEIGITAVHDDWLVALERLASDCGLRGHRVLDVACGTGSSFLPLLELGYEVTACDISRRMAQRARRRAGGRARVHVADMRALPVFGWFDLITCLDDAINHLLTPDDVVRAFEGMASNLAPEGLVMFDMTTVATYGGGQTAFIELGERIVVMRDGESTIARAGDSTRMTVELFTRTPLGLWRRTTSAHGHRHYPLTEMRELLAGAGLKPVAVRGQWRGGRLAAEPDEGRHHKLVVVATHTRGG
jgi:SAM-dependent methyltransferase